MREYKQIIMAKQIPTVGDRVIYTPAVNDSECRNNGAEANPAIVTQSFSGNVANLTVFPVGKAPQFIFSACHKKETNNPEAGYWQWEWEYNRD